jgi:hypothetical protein
MTHGFLVTSQRRSADLRSADPLISRAKRRIRRESQIHEVFMTRVHPNPDGWGAAPNRNFLSNLRGVRSFG